MFEKGDQMKKNRIKITLLWWLLLIINSSLYAENKQPIEIHAGMSALLYQHIFSFQTGMAFEASVSRELKHNCSVSLGTRVGIDPLLPEIFIRMGAKHTIKFWTPEGGLELGYSKRSQFKNEKLLLSEMQNATDKNISPFYIAFYANPLNFTIRNKYNINMFDIQIGSHFDHLGRTVRLQTSLVNLGVKL